jgi:hypothetical protein
MNLVETVGNAPTAAILQGSPAPLCCPRARGPYRADSCASSARRNDLICHPGFNVVRTTGIEPTSSEWHSEAQPIDHVRAINLVGSGWNRTSCPKGLRLQRSDGTSLSLLALPVIGCRSASRTLPKTAYETARTTGSTCIEDHCDAGISAVAAKLDVGLISASRIVVVEFGGEPRT